MQQARTNFMGLRKKFLTFLQNREPMVQRADLGEKGIFLGLALADLTVVMPLSVFVIVLKLAGRIVWFARLNNVQLAR